MKTEIELRKDGMGDWIPKTHSWSSFVCGNKLASFFIIPEHIEIITAEIHDEIPPEEDYVMIRKSAFFYKPDKWNGVAEDSTYNTPAALLPSVSEAITNLFPEAQELYVLIKYEQ